ncbi:RHS repeat-associated protein [Chitinophaga sp. W2I13]|uniref:RHS repeat protein n=1 Tax=Chitinophaga sp. W2I13 TaxID=3373923 RepID=UPI003D236900
MGWLCTYYIYDDLNNLRVVVSPRATAAITGNWSLTAALMAELCFVYRYDERQRMIVKKIPGSDSTELVYDVRDRVVFSRNGNMKGENWLVTFYDNINRPVMTALYNSAAERSALQSTMNNATSNTQTLPYTFPAATDLVLNNHDGTPLYQATQSITMTDGFDTGTGMEMTAEISATANNGIISLTITNPLPNIPAASLTPLTYLFYGNYTFPGKQNYVAGDKDKVEAGGNPYPEALPATPATTVNGMLTGTKTRILGTDQWLTTTNYYNTKERLIQSVSNNITGGTEVNTNLYDFNGKLLSNYYRHRNQRSSATPQTTLLTILVYDATGRVASIKKRLNDVVSQEKTIEMNAYNELGQLASKRLGINGSGQLETLNYEYNIRGWLKSINKGFVNSDQSTANWFGQELSYDYGFDGPQYTGNIAGAKWKSKSDGKARAYGYSYDKVNRLTGANFTENNSGVWNRTTNDFSVSNLSYDANGNINTMNQSGKRGSSSGVIDQLTYTYQSNSNKLMKVKDVIPVSTDKLGDFEDGINTNDDYAYDANGNLIKDENKKINTISYNHLNLAETIAITEKGEISYLYDANGTKLRKIVADNTGTINRMITTDYIDNFVYQNDTLQFIGHEDGRIRPVYVVNQPVSYWYDYFLKDHLGNVRMVLTEQSDLSVYAASMETANAATETQLFSNIDNTRIAKPAGYPATDSSNKSVAKLTPTGNGKKTGPSLVLRVMAGDTIAVSTNAFYKSTGPQKDKAPSSATNMLADLIQTFGGNAATTGTHGNSNAGLSAPFTSSFYNNDYQQLKEKEPDQQNPDRPKAYLNFVLFDDQFKLVEENSGVKRVTASPDELQKLIKDKMPIKKSGFLYVYTSNESNQDVYFDDVVVTQASGPLLEETHYYPFGLTMAGISSSAIKGPNYPENKYKYNKGAELQNKEFSDGSGWEMYATPIRSLDPQLGRWWQVDPKPDYAQSLYSAMYNNPISFNDPLGDTARIQFRTGFLGLGGRKKVDYNGGKLTNTDGSAYTGKVKGFLKKAVAGLK